MTLLVDCALERWKKSHGKLFNFNIDFDILDLDILDLNILDLDRY